MIHGGDIEGYFEKYNKKPLDFSANISPFGLPEGVKKAIISAVDSFDIYPDPLCRRLTNKLSNFYNIPSEYIICSNGAAELIFNIIHAIKPKKALVTAPTFAEYEQALLSVDCNVENYILKEENEFNILSDFCDRIDSKTDIVFICQPNNPTGQICKKSLLLSILEKCEITNTFLIVDECFTDMLDDESISISDHIKSHKNLFILKAFTKTYAMAGIRLGYGFTSNTDLISRVRKCSQPWSVSSVAQLAGEAALDEKDYVFRLKNTIKAEREYLKKSLSKLNIKYYGSNANFIFFKSDIPLFDEKLRNKGIMIRSCSNYIGLKDGYYRIAVKTHSDNEILIEKIIEILKEEQNG